MPVAVLVVVFEVSERMTMRRAGGGVIVLEWRLKAMAMAASVGRLRRRGHHDVGVAVPVGAVGAVRVLDDLEQPVHMGLGVMVMAVLVLVVVPMRH
ncbi:MAG: hypothetical protein E6J32_08800 [Chloroflexi bacterium]|nr:MAG: hypothetical protein E6J32_08800 [Chloroflexota bacterium]